MSIYRLIFRLDFEPNFQMFDSTGKIMGKLLSETIEGNKFLPELLERSQGHGVAAKYVNETSTEMRMLTIEPVSIHGSFELSKGVSLEKLEQNVVFEKIIKLVNEFRREFGIEVLTRCGIRFFYLSKFNSDDENIISKFNILFNNNLVDTVENKLGSISDVGIIFEGQNKDLTKYRVHFGPYSKKESDRYFPTISNYLKTVDEFNFIADIDLYEANFTLHSSVSFMKWCNPLIKKAHDYVSDIKSIII